MLLPAVHAFVHGALLLSAEHAGQTGDLNKAVNGFEMYVAQLLYSDDVGDDVVIDAGQSFLSRLKLWCYI